MSHCCLTCKTWRLFVYMVAILVWRLRLQNVPRSGICGADSKRQRCGCISHWDHEGVVAFMKQWVHGSQPTVELVMSTLLVMTCVKKWQHLTYRRLLAGRMSSCCAVCIQVIKVLSCFTTHVYLWIQCLRTRNGDTTNKTSRPRPVSAPRVSIMFFILLHLYLVNWIVFWSDIFIRKRLLDNRAKMHHDKNIF